MINPFTVLYLGVPQQQYQPVQVYMTNPPPPPGPTVVAVEVVPLGGRCGRCQVNNTNTYK